MSARSRRTENDIDVSIDSFKASRIVFCTVILALLILPFIAMIWAPTNETVENRELAPAPSFVNDEGEFNYNVLSDAGAYFDDHYAFRTKLIDAGAHLYAALFDVSTADTVVVGDNNWLYYAGTLKDYQGTSPLRDAEASNIAYNLKIMQDACEERSIKFAFAIAPNKNSLYGQDMPYYYPEISSADMSKLSEALSHFGVNSVPLHRVIENEDERLYFYRDSHWTEKGALFGHDAIARAAGFKTLGLSPDKMLERDDYTGDLALMLFPESPDPEPDWYFKGINDGSGATGDYRSGSLWDFLEGESVEDSSIATEPSQVVFENKANESNEGADDDGENPNDDNQEDDIDQSLVKKIKSTSEDNGKLLMFRDSFGNSLIPYLSCEFSSSIFSKMLPMNFLLIDDESPDVVLVERAQRHVDYFAEEAPLMYSPILDEPVQVDDALKDKSTDSEEAPEQVAAGFEGVQADFDISTNGPLGIIKGFLKGDVQKGIDDQILVRLVDEEGLSDTYKAFALSDAETENDDGFCINVDLELWANQDLNCQVILKSGDEAELLVEKDVRFEV